MSISSDFLLVISIAVIFGIFKAEANIIMRHHKVPYLLSSDSKMLDLEWPSDAILC